MIEHLEFSNLHLKADRRVEDPAGPICTLSKPNHSNSDSLPRISAHSSVHSEPVLGLQKLKAILKAALSGTLIRLNRNVTLIQVLFQRKAAMWAAFCSPATPAPTPPVSLCEYRNTVVGAGLLVHYGAHIAELIKNTYSIQTNPTNIKNPRFQCFEFVIELVELNVTLLGSLFEKILSPGSIQIAGDIRRQ